MKKHNTIWFLFVTISIINFWVLEKKRFWWVHEPPQPPQQATRPLVPNKPTLLISWGVILWISMHTCMELGHLLHIYTSIPGVAHLQNLWQDKVHYYIMSTSTYLLVLSFILSVSQMHYEHMAYQQSRCIWPWLPWVSMVIILTELRVLYLGTKNEKPDKEG